MKRNSKRRAFTIVELVIVIAVIAVLAAVLIPVFSNVIQKARDSAAMQEAQNAYIQYLIDHAADGESAEFMIYNADGRYVALDSGVPIGVYDNGELALEALFGDEAEKYVVPDPDANGLFICRTLDSDEDNEDDKVDANSDELAILAIGDIYTVDAMKYVAQIAKDIGVDEITIGILGINDSSLSDYADTKGANDATYYSDIGEALSRKWDFVIFQQNSGEDEQADTYDGNLNYMISYVQVNMPDAKLVWYMNGAKQPEAATEFSLIIPSFTAVQNSQTSIFGNEMTDGYHRSYEYNCYLNGLMVVRTLIEKSVDSVTYVPTEITEIERLVAIESVNNAAAKPFEVTQSAYALPDDYEILTP